MEMEPAAAWGRPCYEFQPAGWTVEEPVSEVWAPAPAYSGGLPVEYASIDIFGSCCSLPAYVPQSVVAVEQEQLVEYYFSADPRQQGFTEISADTTTGPAPAGNTTGNRTVGPKVSSYELEKDEEDLKVDIGLMQEKIHRYPASLGDLDESYTAPRIVAIGPYYNHNLPHLKQAEEMKVQAATHCVRASPSRSREELFAAVVDATNYVLARSLYDTHGMAVEGIELHEFQNMMFYDACFLVQYMLMLINRSHRQKLDDSSLHSSFLSPNFTDILHDVTLLENQLPWKVVEAVMEFVPEVSSKDFITSLRGWLQDYKLPRNERRPFVWDERYKIPHLLGLLRYYTVGSSSDDEDHERQQPKKRLVSASAMELARIGITLTPGKTTELIHMGLNKKWVGSSELSLPPLSLRRDTASILVNMAAMELCTVRSFIEARDEDSAVCSYLLLLAMLAYRVEDVHELRRTRILHGGGGLTNEEALRFFTSLQSRRLGKRYVRIMNDIQRYKENQPTAMSACFCRYYNDHNKTIKAVVAGVVSVGSIIVTLLSIKDKL